ncbi:MAG: type IIL restriction-modification enzyme MmeI [Candidatus Dormibacterales bacterium]
MSTKAGQLQPAAVLADSAVIVVARDDDYIFALLQSSIHDVWARGLGTQLREVESGFRYTPTTTFETFPFPRPTATLADAIAKEGAELNRLREGWLNPAGASADELEKRTLTNLYNERPAWLRQVHERLNHRLLEAYGLPTDISDEDLLRHLLDLNLSREAV